MKSSARLQKLTKVADPGETKIPRWAPSTHYNEVRNGAEGASAGIRDISLPTHFSSGALGERPSSGGHRDRDGLRESDESIALPLSAEESESAEQEEAEAAGSHLLFQLSPTHPWPAILPEAGGRG